MITNIMYHGLLFKYRLLYATHRRCFSDVTMAMFKLAEEFVVDRQSAMMN